MGQQALEPNATCCVLAVTVPFIKRTSGAVDLSLRESSCNGLMPASSKKPLNEGKSPAVDADTDDAATHADLTNVVSINQRCEHKTVVGEAILCPTCNESNARIHRSLNLYWRPAPTSRIKLIRLIQKLEKSRERLIVDSGKLPI